MQGRKLVRCPCNRVGFTRTSTVLDQVFIACALNNCSINQLGDYIPLMVTREDQGFFLGFTPLPIFFFFNLKMDKAPDDIEQVVWR